MLKLHERTLRGKTKTGWLDGRHTFSFGYFHDPERMGFRALRVINEDRVIPGAGFPTHPHDNMEILTYIVEGELEHKDSMGTGSVIRPGEIQKMSAGSGVTHSEFNPSKDNPVHLLQIWIMPDARDVKPSYEQIKIVERPLVDGWRLIADKAGTDGAVSVHQDIRLFSANLLKEQKISYRFAAGRYGFLQLVKGEIFIGDEAMKEGDGLEISGVENLDITAKTEVELLLFDLA